MHLYGLVAAPFVAYLLGVADNADPLVKEKSSWIQAALLVGVAPAFMVFWIRRHVPEPEEWTVAKARAGAHEPGIADLFRGAVRRATLLTIVVCACGLTLWWACDGKSDATPLWNGDKK